MRRYKVVTDNLDWVGAKRDSIIVTIDGRKSYEVFSPDYKFRAYIRDTEFRAAIQSHPEWFSEIKEEEPKEFTREDMCRFASYAHCYHSEKLSYDALLSEWESYYHHK